MNNLDNLLYETNILDYSSTNIQVLINHHGWKKLDDFNKVKQIYDFVRNEILFGYNKDDSLKASEVLNDGYGQCNTKGTLLMALLRAVNIPCRVHGFYITKKLQKGAMTGLTYLLAPKKIFHSYVEVFLNNYWYALEGFILDKEYLKGVQNKFSDIDGYFLGYGVGTTDFKNPLIEFNNNDTFIQKEGIVQDLGVFDSMDDLLNKYHQPMNKFKKFLYQNIGRKSMNRNVSKLRNKYGK